MERRRLRVEGALPRLSAMTSNSALLSRFVQLENKAGLASPTGGRRWYNSIALILRAFLPSAFN